MKLNPEELIVSTFAANASPVDELPTVDTNNPTPQTHCDDCPLPSLFDC